ncbi:MAG: SDR family oxidoreductase [candidate division WOR-3 bacterium]
MTVLVTGGSLGIGYAIAKKCVQEGATVIIVARTQDQLEASLNQLRSLSPKPHRSYSLDVGNVTAVQELARWIEDQGWELNGLVNCAGVLGPIGKTTAVDMGEFTETVRINFLGTVYMCQALAPRLRSQTRKKIVNCSGGGGSFPFPRYSAYAASKAAVVRFTENLALELADEGFDVNCIAPGFVVTRMHQETLTAGPERAGQAHFEKTKEFLEKGGVPAEHAADLTAFLLSQDSDGITGKYISAVWDPWRQEEFQRRLRTDKDFATLRRIDDQHFFRKDSLE